MTPLIKISPDEWMQLWKTTETRLSLSVKLQRSLSTVKADLKFYGLSPTEVVPGHGHLRYSASAGMWLLISYRLLENGFSRAEIREFIKYASPMVQMMPHEDLVGAILVISNGRNQTPNYQWHHATEAAEKKLVERIGELIDAKKKYCVVRLGPLLVEFLERSYCLQQRLDYQELVAARQRETVRSFQDAFRAASLERVKG